MILMFSNRILSLQGMCRVGCRPTSSSLRSSSDYQNKDVQHLHLREWDCPSGGTHHDRDVKTQDKILKMK